MLFRQNMLYCIPRPVSPPPVMKVGERGNRQKKVGRLRSRERGKKEKKEEAEVEEGPFPPSL